MEDLDEPSAAGDSEAVRGAEDFFTRLSLLRRAMAFVKRPAVTRPPITREDHISDALARLEGRSPPPGDYRGSQTTSREAKSERRRTVFPDKAANSMESLPAIPGANGLTQQKSDEVTLRRRFANSVSTIFSFYSDRRSAEYRTSSTDSGREKPTAEKSHSLGSDITALGASSFDMGGSSRSQSAHEGFSTRTSNGTDTIENDTSIYNDEAVKRSHWSSETASSALSSNTGRSSRSQSSREGSSTRTSIGTPAENDTSNDREAEKRSQSSNTGRSSRSQSSRENFSDRTNIDTPTIEARVDVSDHEADQYTGVVEKARVAVRAKARIINPTRVARKGNEPLKAEQRVAPERKLPAGVERHKWTGAKQIVEAGPPKTPERYQGRSPVAREGLTDQRITARGYELRPEGRSSR